MDAQALRREITEEIQMDFEAQMRELRRQKNNAEEELDNATERWRIERRKLKAEIDQLEQKVGRGGGTGEADWQAERERLASEVARLENNLAEHILRTDELRREYEARIEGLVHQVDRLKHEAEAASIVAATEVRLMPAADNTSLDAEMQRVEEAIRAIESLMEDPDTTASMLARKNTERAENEAYLRGLSFQVARSKSA